MHRSSRLTAVLAAACVIAVGVAACGSSGSSSSSSKSSGGGGGKEGGTATVLMGTAPDFLDPGQGYTTQSAEATWLTYVGLLSYKHAAGQAGTQLIPGLAEALPQISKDGKTYKLKLRKGLVFSNGKPVKASDFASTVERTVKANWGGKSFITSYVEGAADFDKGKAKSISGITTDDATGDITIKLATAYGAFGNVLAFPAVGLLPKGTPPKNLSNNPPPGVGPYMITDVKPNRTFTLVKNPKFAGLKIPDVPVGHLDKIVVNITSNTQSEAQQVLNDQADAFDAGDTLPPALLPQIQSKAKDRYKKQTVPSTFYFFLNTQIKPFNNELARQAVNYAIDRQAMVRLASGFLKPACFFLPEGIPGHPTGACPHGSLDKPDLAKAKALVQQSGMAGEKITVWGEERSPRKQYVEYYASVLNKIGFKATPKIIADSVYFPTVGNAKTKAQTGFGDWIQDFPNPSDFYLLLDGKAIQPLNNSNLSNVNDPKIQDALGKLNPVPATELTRVAKQWEDLDRYAAEKAYQVVYGSEQAPQFFGSKLDFASAIFHPLYFNDWSSWQLKQ
ncbi:MAG: peptide/nickel transport system substrate-binding protein [Thermoleophilaceae bacterium]|jgi:peptide/nickel transport system substrate-binding protein|nr:peptide/nickel transport system substrate-binding protein [Thermoleophilaceae bacterium]